MSDTIRLKPIPKNTKNFIIDGDKITDIFCICAQHFNETKQILHTNISYDLSIKLVTQYLIKHEEDNYGK